MTNDEIAPAAANNWVLWAVLVVVLGILILAFVGGFFLLRLAKRAKAKPSPAVLLEASRNINTWLAFQALHQFYYPDEQLEMVQFPVLPVLEEGQVGIILDIGKTLAESQ